MEFLLTLTEEQKAEIIEGLKASMVADGVALREPERTRPYTVAEAAEALTVSVRTVGRWIEAGELVKLSATGKILIPVASVRAKQQEGQRGKEKG